MEVLQAGHRRCFPDQPGRPGATAVEDHHHGRSVVHLPDHAGPLRDHSDHLRPGRGADQESGHDRVYVDQLHHVGRDGRRSDLQDMAVTSHSLNRPAATTPSLGAVVVFR